MDAAQSVLPGLIEKEGVVGIMDFEYVAYGNAHNVGGSIKCQHGERECLGNMAETCAKNATNADPRKYMPFVVCLEDGSPIEDSLVRECASQSGLDADDISSCTQDGRGASLMPAEEKKTKMAQLSYVPYFTFNGEQAGYYNLLSQVCDYWQGERPSGCDEW
eukprot:TRINITY_DN1868_c0_g4_i1.p1 TRINITY_DN1868_c0_g4~~TRINITY_DN1868_c0_g4_i1.p1  ORF type:complete len:162 (+),score=83.78 TRINITY_DN1868_c0_g4_i1:166-651(+)